MCLVSLELACPTLMTAVLITVSKDKDLSFRLCFQAIQILLILLGNASLLHHPCVYVHKYAADIV